MPFWENPIGSLMPMAGPLDTVTVVDRANTTWSFDSEGRTIESQKTFQVDGRLTQIAASELADIGRFGESVVAVFLAPLNSGISDKDQIVAVGVDPYLDGTYEITTVRWTPMHLRCLLRKAG